MTPEHRVALQADNEVRRLRTGLDLCTIGLAAWCHRVLANDTYQRSPSDKGVTVHVTVDDQGNVIEADSTPDGDVKLTTVEAQAFHHPDPLVAHARAYLDAVKAGHAGDMIRHATVICNAVPPADRADPCRRCGKPNLIRSKKTGECSACERETQRERERVA